MASYYVFGDISTIAGQILMAQKIKVESNPNLSWAWPSLVPTCSIFTPAPMFYTTCEILNCFLVCWFADYQFFFIIDDNSSYHIHFPVIPEIDYIQVLIIKQRVNYCLCCLSLSASFVTRPHRASVHTKPTRTFSSVFMGDNTQYLTTVILC